MAKFLTLIPLLLLPCVATPQDRPLTDGDCTTIARLNITGADVLRRVCQAARQIGGHGERIGEVERDLNLGLHRDDRPGRLKQIEHLDIGTRLNTIESVNAKDRLDKLEANAGLTKADIRRIWVLLAAVLVFFMQAGFKCLEVGVARQEHGGSTALLNLSNWMILCLVYWFCGFGIMFGSWSTTEATHLLCPTADQFTAFGHTLRFEFFLFQLAFAATAATIVDGALAERVSLPAYFAIAVTVGALIYPVFGHWAWGGAVDGTGAGWLAAWGFKDFAGSTVVHSVGAWVAWIGLLFLGPRRYRFGEGRRPLRSFNLGYSVLGVFMLWFGWWGFNGGSLSRFDDQDFFGKVASVILHTNLAGAAAGLSGYVFAIATGRKSVYEKMIGGTLGGLVAITASCDSVNAFGAIAIGIAAGVLHDLAFDWMGKWKQDDVAGAIPVHGFCGVLGTLCAAFGTSKIWYQQLWIQTVGIVVAALWAVIVSVVLFAIVERVCGLRTSIRAEDQGDAVASLVA